MMEKTQDYSYVCSTPDVLDVSYIRQQIRPILFIDSVRANNRGYPERMAFRDFRRRFQCLVEADKVYSGYNEKTLSIDQTFDDRIFTQKILEKMEIYEHRYRLGLSQILLRNDVLIELEEKRDLSLSGLIIDFQRQCRKHLAQKWLAKRRVQEIAIKCIQKNARFHLRIRHWPWWNLYTKILPLLSVARVDHEQREWRERYAALEMANINLKSAKLKADGELAELEQHLKMECQTTQKLSLSLEQESQARVQLEAEIRRLQQQIIQQKAAQNLHSNAPGEGNTEGKNGVETDAEINKKTCELKAVRSEMSKLRDQELTLKLKNQKTTEQLLDVQAETGNLRARNEQLEKRQKDFDGEMKLLRERLTELSEQKCRLEARCADFDASVKERNAQIQSLKNENSEQRANLVKARRELDEVLDANTSKAGDVAKEEELLTLRKAKRDLEAKLSEIEGELEETVIRNQTLEQKVIRLEMSTERLRSDLQREADGKEAEMAEMRAQYQRRMRTFEDEINELNDVNSSLQKQNRIIESRARQFDTQSQASSLDLGGSSLFYKRELRKALVLLRDTQSLLAHEREGAPNQSIVRQLKEQLEDAESAKLAALRSRHSLESEISDLRNQLDLANAAKNSADEKVLAIMRDKNSANALAQEHDEQLQDLLKKYKAQIQQSHTDSITLADQVEQIANLERAKQRLQEQLNEAAVNIEFNKLHTVEKHKVQLMQLKLRDLQSKLDLEISQKLRFESITAKLKEQIECLQEQLMEIKSARDRESELAWKIKKDYKMQQEEINDFKKRETDLLHRQKMAKLASDQLNEEHEKTLTNLRLALKRIDTLQAALNADLTAGSDIEEEDEDINDREDEEDITDGDLAASVSAAVNESIVSNNNIATIESTAKTNGKLATSSLTDDESTNGRKNELNGLGSVC